MKHFATALGIALALGFPLFALAVQGTCSVTPEQVPLGSFQMAISLGQRLDDPGSLTMIQSLVGIALQRMVLNAMDPNSPSGGTGQTVQNHIDALAQRREAIRALAQQAGKVLPTMSDQDLISYFDRMKIFGEQAAVRWAASRHDPQ